jgi:hypothetical protein
MMTCAGRLNQARWLVLRAGERGASHRQQIDLRVKSTALLSHTSGPRSLMPHRLK